MIRRDLAALISSLALLALAGCARTPGESVPDASLALSLISPSELSIPDGNLPEGVSLSARIPLRDGWESLPGAEGGSGYRRPLPVRPRTMLTDRAPKGLRLLDASGSALPHASQAAPRATRWEFDESTLSVFAETRIDPKGLLLEDLRAPEREARLNRALSGAASDLEFVRASFYHAHATRAGLLVPAPGLIRFELLLPRAPRLHFAPCLVPPEIAATGSSDGVTMRVTLRSGEASEETLWSERVVDARCPAISLDLSRWEGRRVTLTLASDPGASADLDYAFFADPVVVSERPEPRRVVMLFVDTLRADHLGYAGYERATTPRLDALAGEALVFENARAPAPWTLPSARALLTGRHPDRFAVSTTLPEPLRERGWASAFFGGNAFVSASYGLERGWGLHRADQGLGARRMVDQGLRWLEDQPGRDALLLLHFMDAHLPYEEPASYRRLFAGDAPESLGERFDRWDVKAAEPLPPAARGYVVGRYDNNLRYLDDEIARLLDALDEEDIVVFFSDHGEEFWEHGGFEHGHALYDELLRVPMLVRAPGLRPGVVAEPVSLLDLMPTLLDLLDVPSPETEGRSLRALTEGDASLRERLAARELAFGWPLYGAMRWGSQKGGTKYLTHVGVEELYDLAGDPGETVNLLQGRPWGEGAPHRETLAAALGREVRLGFMASVQSSAPRAAQRLDLRLQAPGGFEKVWSRERYLRPPSAGIETGLDEGVVYARWQGWFRTGHPVLALPQGDFESAWAGLQASARIEGRVGSLRVETAPELLSGRSRGPLALAALPGGLRLMISPVVTPMPLDPREEGVRYDAESEAALRSLGYTGDEPGD